MLLVLIGNVEMYSRCWGDGYNYSTVTNKRSGQSDSDHETKLLGYSTAEGSIVRGTALRTLGAFPFSQCVDW